MVSKLQVCLLLCRGVLAVFALAHLIVLCLEHGTRYWHRRDDTGALVVGSKFNPKSCYHVLDYN